MQWPHIRRVWEQLRTLDNVVGVGQGEKIVRGHREGRPVLTVLVTKKMRSAALPARMLIPHVIEDCPTDVIEVGEIRLHAERTGIMRPARPGVSIGHYHVSAGTFGAVVYDRLNGEKLILSNNHILANLSDGQDGRCVLGDKIWQPAAHDGGTEANTIATLERFVPLHREFIKPICPWAQRFEAGVNSLLRLWRPRYHIQVQRDNEKYNLVDCAVARPLNPADIDDDILGIGSLLGMKEPQIGMAVKKSGRSSGVTHSNILAMETIMKVMLAPRENAIFERQLVCGPMSSPGDSGSLVLSEDNYAIGLLFAGSEMATICNRIDCVSDALQINITFTTTNN